MLLNATFSLLEKNPFLDKIEHQTKKGEKVFWTIYDLQIFWGTALPSGSAMVG